MQKERMPFSVYPELRRLMETGEPVCVTFETGERGTEEGFRKAVPFKETVQSQEAVQVQKAVLQEAIPKEKVTAKGNEELSRKLPEKSGFLFCELVQKARMGEKFRISGQGCSPGDYILSFSEENPAGYYLKSGRYRNKQAAEKAALSLPRLKRNFCSIVIEPLSLNRSNFDVLILFIKPEKAMRIVQTNAYFEGKRTLMDTMGAASICGDCTVLALEQGIGLSFGCKGSRKHSGYKDFEVPLGIAFEKVKEIEEGLSRLPETAQ